MRPKRKPGAVRVSRFESCPTPDPDFSPRRRRATAACSSSRAETTTSSISSGSAISRPRRGNSGHQQARGNQATARQRCGEGCAGETAVDGDDGVPRLDCGATRDGQCGEREPATQPRQDRPNHGRSCLIHSEYPSNLSRYDSCLLFPQENDAG